VTELELFRAALVHTPQAVSIYERDGTVLYMNPATERLTGLVFAQVRGTRIFDHLLEAPFRDAFLRVAASGHAEDVEHYSVHSGLWSLDHICLIGDHVHIYAQTITSEHKRVERGRQIIANATALLNQSLDIGQTLRQVVRAPLDGFADWCAVDIVAEDGTLDRTFSSDDTAPRLPTRVAHDPTYDAVRAAIAKREVVIRHDIDDARIRSMLSVPMLVADTVLGALSIGSQSREFDDLDVSILGELANHAAIAIENARLYDEAQAARREAEGANRAKDEFMAMLGHELRNPLAPIVTALDLMNLRAPGQLERERAVIGRQVHHLSRLVDDLLDVSRITRGKVELHRERLALAAIVAKAIEQTSPLLEQKNHRLVVDVPFDLAVVGDPLRLAQIIGNLVGNAAKYTPESGLVEVTAHADDEGRVVLVVRDNGIGIAPDILPHVFDMFVQAPQSSSRPAGGLGLGLTIVKSLVEMHGGTVAVASEGAGKGSSFSVSLPAASERIAVVEPAPPMQIARSQSPRRILVVDDNEDAAMLLASVLEAHGHEVRTAFDGPSALRILSEFHPEVAVLDIGLPVMDGYELAERLLSTPQLSNVRLIAVSGYGQESDRARAHAAGFQAHLAKPVPIDTLVRLVDEAS
jgi:signal transduction histidine kinase